MDNLHSLDPSVGGSGPHGLTVRITPHVLRPNASIAARLTSGDEWPSRPPCRGGMASLNHNFDISERSIFLLGGLDSSGKTGGGFLGLGGGPPRQHPVLGREMSAALHPSPAKRGEG